MSYYTLKPGELAKTIDHPTIKNNRVVFVYKPEHDIDQFIKNWLASNKSN